jgi:hypothetical protein
MQIKQFKLITTIIILCGPILSCNKNIAPPFAAVSLNIANANVGSQGVIPNFGTPGFSYANSTLNIGYGSASNCEPEPGNISLSIVQSTDTSQTLINRQYNLKIGGIYSLFVAGSTTSPDTLFVQDNIPVLPVVDSVTGVRFVNLVQGSGPISIDILANSGAAIVTSLAYKSISGFQQFPANSVAQGNGYIFEFRDAISDSLLASYPLNIVLSKNQTLVYYGSIANGLSVFSENNY